MSRRHSLAFSGFGAVKIATFLLAFVVALLGFNARPASALEAWWTLTVTPSPTHFTGPGQVITYTYFISSSYGSTGFIDSLTDDKVTITDCPAHTSVPLAGLTCHGTYTTTAVDVSNGSITDHASVSGDACSDGCLTSAAGNATITFSVQPSWTLTKTARPSTFTAAGQTINYRYLVSNTGNVAISAIALADDKISSVSCPSTSLAAGAHMTCAASYLTTNADVTAGSVTNSATAQGTPAAGTLADVTASATITLRAKPSWTLTTTPNVTTFSAAGQTIQYSYMLSNTGDVAISAISLTDDTVGAVACPATSLGIGADMNCSGSYVTTAADVANHRVVNTATASGTPASGTLHAAKARATIRFVATVGSITITTTASGGNETFNFASTVPPAKAFSLTTVGGKASRSFSHLKPGTYVVSEAGLPPQWKLNALSCTGDTGGRPIIVDLARRSVSIGLDSNEAIVCTFANKFDTDTVTKKTKQVIARFLGHRLEMLLDEEPDRARFLRRVPGALWGEAPYGSAGTSSQPFSFAGASDGLGSDMNFATSLSQIMHATALAEEKSRAANEKNVLAAMPAKASKAVISPDTNVDVWLEAHYKSYSADSGGIQDNGYFGILYLGADYLLTPSSLIGALVQFDWMKENASTVGSMVDGRGAMAGPYFSLRLTPNLFFDSRVAWGLSRNDVNPFGTYTDAFSTDRWLAHARLTGNWHFGNFRVTPSVAFDYGQEHQQSYTDSNGLLIPAQMVSLGRISFGPEFAERFVLGNGTVFEPLVSLTGKWDFANGTYASAAGLPADGESFYLKVATGFLARAPGGYAMRLVGSYDGIGNAAFQSWGGEVSINIPLN